MAVIEDRLWRLAAGAAALVAMGVAKPLLERAWRAALGTEPPGNPASEDVSWRDALLWSLLSGALVGVVRLAAQRLVASAWRKGTGAYPESLATTRP